MPAEIFTLKALGTTWWIEIFDGLSHKQRQTIYDSLTLFVQQFENNYSRFNPNSLLNKLNQEGKLENPPAELVEMIKLSLDLYNDTDRIFNIMVGEKLENDGYDQKYSFVAKNETVKIPNPHDVINIENNKITLQSGSIDLGGIGKGYLINLLSNLLRNKFGIQYFLINGGGDIYGTSECGKPITIYLEHPTEAETYLATTEIFNQGFASSSPHKRAWKHGGKSYSHIIDTKQQDTEK